MNEHLPASLNIVHSEGLDAPLKGLLVEEKEVNPVAIPAGLV